MRTATKPRVLYIVYWGAAEPLGQSLVLPAVKELVSLGAGLTLVTFEKPADLARAEEIARIRAGLGQYGIRWIPLRYHKWPKTPATAYDITRGIAEGLATRIRGGTDIIHARTFIGGLIGTALARLLRTKVIYHNEGFYPDEQVDGGVWQENSASHRVAKWLEHSMYNRADGIIAMSHRAKEKITLFPEVKRRKTPVVVVPSCADLDHFRFRPRSPGENDMLRLVYIGTIGGRYLLDRIGRFVAVARGSGMVHLQILTRSNPAVAQALLQSSGLAHDAWSIEGVPYAAMPDALANHDAGLFFLSNGLSEHGCSPTKIGEYWAVGLPVITTPNVSDTDEIIRRERVGVIVHEHTDDAYVRAVRELRSLLKDAELSLRCRRAAETHYALEPACERQVSLYNKLSHEDPTVS